jgi:oligo-1,6-glucosidase
MLLAAVLHLHRGTPYVYQGEELGMTNVPFDSITDFRDIDSLRHYRSAVQAGAAPDVVLEALRRKSRDNARTPMQWSSAPNAGFTSGSPWMSPNPNYREINAAAQRQDEGSVFHFYRRLIALRRTEQVVVDGAFELLLPEDERVWAFVRRHQDVELLVVANLSRDEVVPAPLAARWAVGEIVLSNYPDVVTADSAFRLRPWEVLVVRNREAPVGGGSSEQEMAAHRWSGGEDRVATAWGKDVMLESPPSARGRRA